jgi:DNA invertase Pin-like site-specific DNA recombinase
MVRLEPLSGPPAEHDATFACGRNTGADHTLQDLQAWDVSLVAQTGLQFDLRSAQGKLIASLMAALAEFERDLLRERVDHTRAEWRRA